MTQLHARLTAGGPKNRRRATAKVVAALVVLAICSSTACRFAEPPTNDTAAEPDPTSKPNSVGGSIAGPPDEAVPVDGGKLVFAIEAEPEGLDPTRYAFSGSGHMVASALMDTLMKLDEHGRAVPNLATAVTPSADFMTWTVTLPTGVLFSDGTELTADVVRGNFERYRTSIITAQPWKGSVSVTAPDPTRVVVTWSRPFVSFDALLTAQPGYVFAPGTSENDADDPIGTGPFIRERHELGTVWAFRKNPNYWRPGLPHLDSLEIRPIPDDSVRVAMLQSGDIDMMVTLRGEQINQLRADTTIKRVENAGGEEDHLQLNTAAPPFDSLTARLAVAYATDAARWRRENTADVEAPATGPFAPGQLGYLDDNGYPSYDLERAKTLVKQYEQETGRPFEFEFITQLDVSNQADSNLLTDMYTAAGMKVTVKAIPQINLIAAAATAKFQMLRFRLFSTADPDMDAVTFLRGDQLDAISTNFARLNDAEVNDAIARATGTTDPSIRDAAYQTVNRRISALAPYIWLGRAVWLLVAQPKVNGIYTAANGTIQTLTGKPWVGELWIAP